MVNVMSKPYLVVMTRLFLIVALAILSQTLAPVAQADVLQTVLWKNRVLILFDASRSSASLDRQIDMFRQRRSELKERDLVVISNPGKSESASVIGYVSVPQGSNRSLRARFRPSESGMTVILIGKDGIEKARWQKLVQADEIFALIDSMPMRKKEIKDNAVTN